MIGGERGFCSVTSIGPAQQGKTARNDGSREALEPAVVDQDGSPAGFIRQASLQGWRGSTKRGRDRLEHVAQRAQLGQQGLPEIQRSQATPIYTTCTRHNDIQR